MNRSPWLALLLLSAPLAGPSPAAGRDPWPIDPLWRGEAFRRAFTASYGSEGRIEPLIDSEERAALDAVAAKMRAGDRPGAIAGLAGHSRLGSSAALRFTLGNLRFEEGQPEEAAVEFEKALELHPGFRDARRNLAMALAQLGRLDQAGPHLVRALELGARDGLTLGLLGYVHASAGRHQAALQAYRQAQLTMPEEAQWKLGEAQALLALDDPRATASIYEELLATRPSSAQLWIGRADASLRLGEGADAIASLELARRMEQLDPADTLSLGHLYLNESLPGAALDCYREAIRSAAPPPLAKAIDALEALARFQRWAEAGELAGLIAGKPGYAEALAADPPADGAAAAERSRHDRALGLIALGTGGGEEAASRVEELTRRDPLDGQALILLARFRLQEEETAEAIHLLEQAARIPSSEAEALRLHGQLLVARADYPGALALMERSAILAPDPVLDAYLDVVRALVD